MSEHTTKRRNPAHPHYWIPEFLLITRKRPRRQIRLMLLATLVGVATGTGAVLFYVATVVAVRLALGGGAGYWPEPHPGGEPHLIWPVLPRHEFIPGLLLLIPAVGGLLSGLLVGMFAPEAEGHGTDAAIKAYHEKDGLIRPRVPLVKTLASALTIGSGGSGGREGPIAQIGAGIGSTLANLLGLAPSERRVLMAAGVGAGVAAIFRAPLAGALFAAEVLYWSPEFESEVIIPAGIASVVSYCTFGSVFGWAPLFRTPDFAFHNPLELGPYLLLALAMTTLAGVYTRSFYGFADLFHKLKLPPWMKPALGAFLTGAVGLALYYATGRRTEALSVLSFGYDSLQRALDGDPTDGAGILMIVALGKILTTSLTIGSGGSGGVFGPSMVIGGCSGGALGLVFHHAWPRLVPYPASYVVLGMGGFFAAAAKTPFSTLVIVSELTGSYHMLLPAIWVCVISFMLSDEHSLFRSQVENRAASPAHRRPIHPG
ncbi:MAG TPA: chloride channel protein [Planctomycetota bacterium]|nr:chloride channel protein [Planctomycetota bacterium]